eukprot:9987182-Alexandrium_andersonii.AAC.1
MRSAPSFAQMPEPVDETGRRVHPRLSQRLWFCSKCTAALQPVWSGLEERFPARPLLHPPGGATAPPGA